MPTLEFLKSELKRVEAEIAPLETVRYNIKEAISDLESDLNLAAIGLKRGDSLAISPEFLSYCRIKSTEMDYFTDNTVYCGEFYTDQGYVYIYTSPSLDGTLFGASVEIVQAMRAAYLQQQEQEKSS